MICQNPSENVLKFCKNLQKGCHKIAISSDQGSDTFLVKFVNLYANIIRTPEVTTTVTAAAAAAAAAAAVGTRREGKQIVAKVFQFFCNLFGNLSAF